MTTENEMKPGHEERRRDGIIRLLCKSDYVMAEKELRYLIADLSEDNQS